MDPKFKGAYEYSFITPEDRTENSNLLRGTINLSKAELSKFAPHYTGYTHIFVTKNVSFMAEYKSTYDGTNGTSIGTPFFDQTDLNKLEKTAKTHAMNLKNLIEFASISYSGTPDLSLSTATVETGYSDINVIVPTGSAFDGDSFTIKILEQYGEPLRKAIEFYTTGLYDPYAKIGHLHGSNHVFRPDSYAMEIAIVQFDPTMKFVQDISYWQNVVIKPVDRSNLDWNQGQVDVVSPRDVQFTGRYVADAKKFLEAENFKTMIKTRIDLIKRIGDFELNL